MTIIEPFSSYKSVDVWGLPEERNHLWGRVGACVKLELRIDTVWIPT